MPLFSSFPTSNTDDFAECCRPAGVWNSVLTSSQFFEGLEVFVGQSPQPPTSKAFAE